MKKEREWNGFRRFVMPILSIISCIFMVIAAIFSHGIATVFYLIVFIADMLIAAWVASRNKKAGVFNE
jgi:APA family basic amino acid/polyamine antiporter